MRLQVFLDRAGFGPGIIDGRRGEFTRKAVVEYLKANPQSRQSPDPGKPAPASDQQAQLPIPQQESPFAEYTVKTGDEKRVGPAPKQPREQARLKWLPYSSVLELVSEKFHSSEELLRRLNPQLKGRQPKAGDTMKVPNVKPFEIAAAEARRTDEEAPEAKEQTEGPYLDIDIAQKELELRENDRLLAAFPITPGSATLPAPKGHWHIQTITFMPKFRFDPEMLYHGKRGPGGIVTPPGPNNKVGVLWMGLNKRGVGIHGTDQPETIGKTTSHGCIRLSNWDAARLAQLIQPGAKVIIH